MNPNYVNRISSQVLTIKNLKQQLEELYNVRKKIIENMKEGIIIVDTTNNKIVEVNISVSKLTKYPRQKLIGMDVNDVFQNPTDKPNSLQKTIDNPSNAIILNSNGEKFLVDIRQAVFLQKGRIYRLLFINRPGCSQYNSLNCYFVSQDNLNDDFHEIDFPSIIGKNKKIRQICHLIGRIAKTSSTVLIEGENGTGKEVIAQTIHYHSHRAKGKFVKINCAALTETLLESELFGHVKGAFTGAIRDRKGRFCEADGGTILLDEIGSMSLSGQTKLLRVLQEHEFEPVGSSQTIKADVRIIATTNVNLFKAVQEGSFREDLYYRLNVINIHLPALRERKEDIPLLASYFLKKYSDIVHKKFCGFTPETISILLKHTWPGNVRELENAIEYAVVIGDEGMVQPDHLPTRLTISECDKLESVKKRVGLGLKEQLDILEKQIVLQTLYEVNWVSKNAALNLGIDPRNFNYFLKKHNITVTEKNVANRN